MSSTSTTRTDKTQPDAWYKYGVAFLFAEMGIALAVCGYSLFMAFTGSGGFPGH